MQTYECLPLQVGLSPTGSMLHHLAYWQLFHFMQLAGCVVYHRSGDATVGVHGNSGLWRPTKHSHRIALVLYQTDLKAPSAIVPIAVNTIKRVSDSE